MSKCCPCGKLKAILETVQLGLLVLWTEIRWLAGPDRRFSGRITPLRREYAKKSAELARAATLADPHHEKLAADLSFLETDLRQLEEERALAFAAAHEKLRRKLDNQPTF